MYKEYPPGSAPEAMAALAAQDSARPMHSSSSPVNTTGESQPGLKNLTDHFLEEWFWRPAAIVSYSAGRIAGARSNFLWHGTLSEMGMVVISSTLAALDRSRRALTANGEPQGHAGQHLDGSFPRFADDLAWWAEAARSQRARKAPPY